MFIDTYIVICRESCTFMYVCMYRNDNNTYIENKCILILQSTAETSNSGTRN